MRMANDSKVLWGCKREAGGTGCCEDNIIFTQDNNGL